MLKEQLQKQIEQEGLSKASDFGYDPGSEGYYDLKIAYERGASRYASLWQAAEEKAARYEKALKEIKEEAVKAENESIFIDEFKLRKILAEALTPKTGEE